MDPVDLGFGLQEKLAEKEALVERLQEQCQLLDLKAVFAFASRHNPLLVVDASCIQ